MRNEMHFVTVDNIEIVNPREVLFTINNERHAHLVDPNVVERSMNQFMVMYPRVELWYAYAVDGMLYIKVTGDFDHEVAMDWIEKVRR